MDHENSIFLGIYLSVVFLLTFVSVLTNGFIITVNIRDWLSRRILSPVEQLLVALGVSNTGLSYLFGNYIYFLFLWPQFFLVDSAFPAVFSLMLFMTLSSSWLTAWLCLYFFVKIVRFKSSFLGKLKLTIDVAVQWLIVISELVALCTSLPVIWSLAKPLPYNSTSCHHTCPVSLFQLSSMYYIFALGFSSNSAFLIVLVSAVCIVWSLCRHTHRMKKTMSSDEDSHFRTHRRAARTVASLLLIYIVFYVTFILMTALFYTNNFSIYFWITVWLSLSTSPAMSLVLIHGNAKLSLAFREIFCTPSPTID